MVKEVGGGCMKEELGRRGRVEEQRWLCLGEGLATEVYGGMEDNRRMDEETIESKSNN